MCASIDREVTLCRALAEVDIRRRSEVYWAARACFAGGPADLPAFNRVFDRFWAGEDLAPVESVAEQGETDPRMPSPAHGGDSTPQYRHEGRSAELLDGGPSRATREIPSAPGDERSESRRSGVLAAYSPEELLAGVEPLAYADDELAAVRRLAEELRRAAPERRSRRSRPARRGGRLDVRRTLRSALTTDGDALRPAYRSHSRKPRRVVLLCDVSGSMERYSRALLGSLRAVVAAGIHAEAFVFATRLTRLTGALAGRDVAVALDEARGSVADWSGGTRIGAVLSDFNRTYARLGLARGSIVIVVSDGWDRGDPALLALEVERLRLQARRLIWLNPRPGEIEGQPLAMGMRAALPYIDDLVAGHDARAVAGIGALIAGVETSRPARRQRPLGWIAR